MQGLLTSRLRTFCSAADGPAGFYSIVKGTGPSILLNASLPMQSAQPVQQLEFSSYAKLSDVKEQRMKLLSVLKHFFIVQ